MFTKILLLSNFLIIGSYGLNWTHRLFPDYFQLGAATASYQIEGAWNVSDKGENIWDRLTHTTDFVDNHETGDVACDSYNNYNRDVEILSELGVDFYRFSISWSRILPTGFDNKISKDGIAYYNKIIDLLLARGITPMITLYHWDLPQPLLDIGGWPNPLLEKYFADFARVAFEYFGDRVRDWVTFNEPFEICLSGFGGTGKAPALGFSGIADYLCAHTLLKAHAKVYHMYQNEFKSQQGGKIGLALSAGWNEPENPESADDREAAEIGLLFGLGWYTHPVFSESGDYPEVMRTRIAQRSAEQGYTSSRLPVFTQEEVEYIRGTSDFFGLNYYTSSVSKAPEPTDEPPEQSLGGDSGVGGYQPSEWPSSESSPWLKVVPWGLTKLLVWIKNTYNNPEVIIMENGYSDFGGTSDTDRIDYYHKHLNAMLDAMDQGCFVTGYTAWSLMDNFEWMEGYRSKFGLYEVDFNDPLRPRTAKDSAKWYKEIVASRTIARDEELKD